MKKLLSWVLSITIVVSSVTPSLGSDSPGIFGGKGSKSSTRRRSVSSSTLAHRILPHTLLTKHSRFKDRILSGKTAGLAQQILALPLRDKAPLLRGDFVALSLIRDGISLPQRVEAAVHYTTQLKQTHSILQVSQSDIASFLAPNVQSESYISATRIQDLLADASALSIVGTREQAPVLVDFYKQAKGTPFEDTALLIAARGLLRMEANEELGALLHENAQNPVLAGMAAYIKEHKISVEVPEGLQHLTVDQANPELAEFLGTALLLNRLHADASLEATERWMEAVVPQEMIPPELLLENESSLAVATTQQRSLLPPAPGGFVQPIRLTSTLGDAAREAKEVTKEEPKLHENTTRSVYEEGNVPEITDANGEGHSVIDNHIQLQTSKDGFKLSVPNEEGGEHVLSNVEVEVSVTLNKKAFAGYNRISLDKNGTFEFRNSELEPERPDHFFFALKPTPGIVQLLLEGAGKLDLSRPLHIKIQRRTSPRQAVTLPVYRVVKGGELQKTQVEAEVDLKVLKVRGKEAEKGILIVDGESIYFRSHVKGESKLLEEYAIRLPKKEAHHWTNIFAMYPQTKFSLWAGATTDKLPAITIYASAGRIGFGKTVGPELKHHTTLTETQASLIMMFLNNVLPPIITTLTKPFLGRFGEVKVLNAGIALQNIGSWVGVAVAISRFLNGGGLYTSLQCTGLLTAITLIALGSGVVNYLTNPLIYANQGYIRAGKNHYKNPETGEEVVLVRKRVVYNMAYLLKRAKEIFRTKDAKALRDLIALNQTTMSKNLGTAAFLIIPTTVNLASKALFHTNLNLDITASFIPYAIFEAITWHKTLTVGLKNLFSLDTSVLRNDLIDLENKALDWVANVDLEDSSKIQEGAFPQKKSETQFLYPMPGGFTQPAFSTRAKHSAPSIHTDVLEIAKKLNDAIGKLVPVESRKDKKPIEKLTAEYEKEFGDILERALLDKGRTPEEAKAYRQAFRNAFNELNHRNISSMDVLRMKRMPAALLAMTAATTGELAWSNNFAFIMHSAIGDPMLAIAIVGALIYGCMYGWRLVGKMLTKRGMKGGSLYLLSSLTAIFGPLAMSMWHDNLSAQLVGAIISCFGISNFFAQMNHYIMNLQPNYQRETSQLIQLSMPVAALIAPLFRLAGHVPGLDMALVSAVMAGSVILTPKMLADSSLIRVAQHSVMNRIVATTINRNAFLASNTRTAHMARATERWLTNTKTNTKVAFFKLMTHLELLWETLKGEDWKENPQAPKDEGNYHNNDGGEPPQAEAPAN